MGKRWRRFSEGLRQRFGETPERTSNGRNQQMLREAEGFARSLRQVDEQLTKVEDDVRGLSLNMKYLLESPVPTPYILSDTGETIRETADLDIVGAGVQVERITTAAEVLTVRLNVEVHAPLREWLSAFDRAKVLLAEVEKTRIEFDSRRRTVTGLEAKANGIRSRLDKGDGKQQRSFEETERKLRHKEEKCANCKTEFEQLEQECSSALRALLKDSSNLRDFLAQSYRVLHETSVEAYGGFGHSHSVPPQPHPHQPYRPSHNIPDAPQAPPQPYRPSHNIPDAPQAPPHGAMVGGY
ncbi:hypothetical protein BSKO_00533 [Bryopsis sp. KO-2023]|nr:hypothetical protein BSKO_00533 [Bryopsis sp. KO-2023]